MSLVASSPAKSRADDEAASGAPEWFAFRQAANVVQAFGHDAAGMGEFSKGTADVSPSPWGEHPMASAA